MHSLRFREVHDYSGRDDSVSIPVVLRSGSLTIPVIASVDTGASFCIFNAEVAEAIGLTLADGVRQRFRTANSSFDAYGHEVEISAFGILTHGMVYFFADPAIEKNVLGRTGWLDRVRLGLEHHESKIYLGTQG